jgi:hypothetical protein
MINAINNYKPTPLAKLTIFPGLGHAIWDKVYKETSALKWLLSFTRTDTQKETTSNKLPIANAGTDKIISLPSNSITLHGSGTDPDGSIASYSWTKKSGGSVSMSGASSKDLRLTSLTAGSYVFTLRVKDNNGAIDSDDVAVNVKTSGNHAPIAYAGKDSFVILPTNSTSIAGSATDQDRNISSYAWSKISGASCSMTGTNTPALKLSGLRTGKYIFRLTVSDTKGAKDTDDILIVVSHAPIVNAGPDKNIILPMSSMTLTGSATDADGTIASYYWSKYSGPSLTMKNTTSRTVTLSGLKTGTYILKLLVKDNLYAKGFDYVKIVVKNGTVTVNPIADPLFELGKNLDGIEKMDIQARPLNFLLSFPSGING